MGVTQPCARIVLAGRYNKAPPKTALEVVSLRRVAQGDGERIAERKMAGGDTDLGERNGR